jgi:hypothetical protein
MLDSAQNRQFHSWGHSLSLFFPSIGTGLAPSFSSIAGITLFCARTRNLVISSIDALFSLVRTGKVLLNVSSSFYLFFAIYPPLLYNRLLLHPKTPYNKVLRGRPGKTPRQINTTLIQSILTYHNRVVNTLLWGFLPCLKRFLIV